MASVRGCQNTKATHTRPNEGKEGRQAGEDREALDQEGSEGKRRSTFLLSHSYAGRVASNWAEMAGGTGLQTLQIWTLATGLKRLTTCWCVLFFGMDFKDD